MWQTAPAAAAAFLPMPVSVPLPGCFVLTPTDTLAHTIKLWTATPQRMCRCSLRGQLGVVGGGTHNPWKPSRVPEDPEARRQAGKGRLRLWVSIPTWLLLKSCLLSYLYYDPLYFCIYCLIMPFCLNKSHQVFIYLNSSFKKTTFWFHWCLLLFCF